MFATRHGEKPGEPLATLAIPAPSRVDTHCLNSRLDQPAAGRFNRAKTRHIGLPLRHSQARQAAQDPHSTPPCRAQSSRKRARSQFGSNTRPSVLLGPPGSARFLLLMLDTLKASTCCPHTICILRAHTTILDSRSQFTVSSCMLACAPAAAAW